MKGAGGKRRRQPATRQDRGAGSPAPSNTAAAPEWAAPPLKPQRRLLVVLSVVLALWVAYLLVLRFATVHPDAEPHKTAPATAPAAAA